MDPKQTTLGNFIDLLNPGNDNNRTIWLKYCQDAHGEKSWQKMRSKPLTENSLIQLAILIAEIITKEAAQWREAEPYENYLTAGHTFLRDVHRIAAEKGITVEIERIDIPIGNQIDAGNTDEQEFG